MKNALRKLMLATLAIFVALATFVAPMCGTLCGVPAHCPIRSVADESHPDACNHVGVSANRDTSSGTLAAVGKCDHPETAFSVAEILSDPLNLRERSAPADRIGLVTLSAPLDTAMHRASRFRPRDVDNAPSSETLLTGTTLLRI